MRLESKITVAVRKRPLNRREVDKRDTDIIDASQHKMLLVKEIRQKLDLTKYIDEHRFIFDAVFGETASNESLYETLLKPLVMAAFDGAKVNCIAFGQTGSGKTYTMMGTLDNSVPGLYFLAARDIFALTSSPGYSDMTVTIGFFEIYCGKAHDLLNNRENCPIRVDAQDNVNIVGLCEAAINSVDSLMKTIHFGLSMRITGQTGANDDSSRSHAILHINLKHGNKLHGRMSFIDLAGSERGADVVDTDKQTRLDGAEINKSLLALKECIRALDLDKRHLPFRGSKLTLVLKDSFIGNCRTVMIGNVGPGQASCEHTLNTLRYADRVKELKKTSASTEKTAISKEDMLAKALMLPRLQKDSHQIKVVEEKETELVIIKPFESVGDPKRGPDSTKDRKTNVKDRFVATKAPDVRKSQGAVSVSAMIANNNSGVFQKDRTNGQVASQQASNVKEKGLPKTSTQPSLGTSDTHEVSEVRSIKVTRINLDGEPSSHTSTLSNQPEGGYRGGLTRAGSPDGLRNLNSHTSWGSTNTSMINGRTSFLKKGPTCIDTSHHFASKTSKNKNADDSDDNDNDSSSSNQPMSRTTHIAAPQSTTNAHRGSVMGSSQSNTKLQTNRPSQLGKSKSFLQASDFIQSLKTDKPTAKKVLADRDPLHRSGTLQAPVTVTGNGKSSGFAKMNIGTKKHHEEKKESSSSPVDCIRSEDISDFQDSYEVHIAELKSILAKDEAILAEMRRQRNLSATGLALFMDAWKNLLNQKIRQVNSWKDKIKGVEGALTSGKSGRIMSIGASNTGEDCIVEESLFDGEEN